MTLRLLMRPSGLLIPFKDLGIEGAPERQLTLGDDLPYVVALNMGHDGNQPRLLKTDLNGNLLMTTLTAAPAHVTLDAVGPTAQGGWVGNSDAMAPGVGGILAGAELVLFNSANWERGRSASAANLAAQSGLGAALSEGAGEWAVSSQPGVGVQASASRAAGGVGVRHVCKGFGISGGSTAAPVLTALTVQIRDGASGAGTVLKTVLLIIAAAAGQNVPPIEVSGLNLIGSANTAMTAEFTAGLANLLECVSLSGYDAV